MTPAYSARPFGTAAKIVLIVVVIIGGLALDTSVARVVHDHKIDRLVEGRPWAQVLKEPGNVRFAVVVVVVLLQFRGTTWRQGAAVMIADAFSGVNGLMKWLVGQHRPYKPPGTMSPRPFDLQPFWHGWHGLFHQVDLSFPSGHVSVAAATAVAIGRQWPAARWGGAAVVFVVAVERVLENAHYVDNVVVGVIVGWLSASAVGLLLPPRRAGASTGKIA